MNPIKLLDFVVKHTAHKSIKYISHVAGTDAGNLHACLSGKRSLPPLMATRVAGAVGLNARMDDSQLSLTLASDTVINLEVESSELQCLSQTIHALSPARPEWRLITTVTDSLGADVYAIAIARFPKTYIVTNIVWPSIDVVPSRMDIQKELIGDWPALGTKEISRRSYMVEWIRLRSGIESSTKLDILFGNEKAVDISEWALMLMELSRLGVSPLEITTLVREFSNADTSMYEWLDSTSGVTRARLWFDQLHTEQLMAPDSTNDE